MKKLIISGIVALSLVASVASAQSYGSCVSISTALSVGSRGSQVLALQQFLVSQNYPGSGTWMETGYFGTATAAAVRDFQQSRGLPQTGAVDSQTLSALQNCGNASTNYNYTSGTYPYTYTGSGYTTYPYTTTYPYNYGYGYNYGVAPTITSLSQNTGTPGQSVTIYGQGFQSTNTVYFNNLALAGVSSSATSLTFTIPYTSGYANNQTVNLYVTNSNGTSNTLSFTLNPSTCGTYGCNTCTTYPYSYSNCGCSNTYSYNSSCGTCGSGYTTYPYNYNCSNGQGNTNSPTITYLTPTSGGVGTVVTIYGSGFTTSGNTVHFGSGILTGYGSPDGQSISFVVPSQLTGFGSQPLTLGSYNVSVTNSSNVTTNAVSFTVTSTNGTGTGAPTITNVSGPTSLSTNQQGTWSMSINTNGGSYTTVSAAWGDTGNGYVNMAAPQVVYNSQTVTFTHAYINPGTYTLTFTVSNTAGQSNTYTSTVYVSGNGSVGYGTPSISSLWPNAAYVGSSVTIYGSNFAVNSMNTILFGSGAIQNVYSNGSTITFTVPSYVSPYCAVGTACPQYAQQITPGTYNVAVMDQNGTSNQVSFTVL